MATTGRDDISPRPYNQDIKEYNRRITTPASNYTGGTPNVTALDTSMLNGGPASSYAAAGSNLDTSMIGTNGADTTPTGRLDTSMIGTNNPTSSNEQQSADPSTMTWTFGTAANGYTNGTINNIVGNVSIQGRSAQSMDDNDSSAKIKGTKVAGSYNMEKLLKTARHSANLFDRSELNLQHRYFRYGIINPYEAVSTGREFLFFTRPDLSILKYPSTTDTSYLGRPSGNTLRNELANIPFWKELLARYPETIYSLQRSYKDSDQIDEPFNLLLSNMVNSNLEVPSLSAEMIDTPTNMYGVGYSYRGSSEASDDNYEFSLEFKDTMNFPIYMYFKTYEEYETLKHHGVIGPNPYYIQNKILHDHTAIYKIIVGEDMETILYYGKYYGVVPKSLPRDIFSSVSFDGGISFSIDFKAAFYRELDPLILAEFNKATAQAWNQSMYRVDVYNEVLMHSDMRPVTAARVIAEAASNAPGGFRYKLKWKGMDVT